MAVSLRVSSRLFSEAGINIFRFVWFTKHLVHLLSGLSLTSYC